MSRQSRSPGWSLQWLRDSKSTARRFVVLEVVEHTTRDEYVVVSGFGKRAQWYRNIVADPKVRVSCGFRRSMAGSALPMTEEEAAAALQRYADRHPKAWANLRTTIETAVGHPVDQLPMVTLRLNSATPEGTAFASSESC
ncbi:MAG: nitroreductase family deazaflavin-dependent oxidoreductase [Pseudonocardiales bacterium]|nr:nitroreductase family deazaflavin-dependent oxidoreductase [Pseudonocardiales bacterium]PZS22754.1 MAG: nitroreductase family deazaflavin-dependent oxidoreductase [Pseudonocardiales bacterium]